MARTSGMAGNGRSGGGVEGVGTAGASSESGVDTKGRDAGQGNGHGARKGSKGHPATRFLALDKCLPGRDFLQVRHCLFSSRCVVVSAVLCLLWGLSVGWIACVLLLSAWQVAFEHV